MTISDAVRGIGCKTKITITVTKLGPRINIRGDNYGTMPGAAALLAQAAAEADKKAPERAEEAFDLIVGWARTFLPAYVNENLVLRVSDKKEDEK